MLKKIKEMDPVVASRLLFGFFISTTLIFAATTVYYHNKAQKQHPVNSVLAAKINKNALSVLDSVGQIMELPANEDPTIATVTDPAKLRSQEFFANAQKGDKVIIYPKSKLAILFRPSTNKIIQAGPGLNQQPTPTAFVLPTVEPTAPIVPSISPEKTASDSPRTSQSK